MKTSPITKLYPGRVSVGNHYAQRVMLATMEGIHVLPTDEIISCKADNNYSTIRMRNGEEIIISKTLKVIEGMLSPQMFSRSHHSYLINLKEVRLIQPMRLQMSDQSWIPISRSRREMCIREIQLMCIQ